MSCRSIGFCTNWEKNAGLLNYSIADSGFTSPSTTHSACTLRLLWKTATFLCADWRLGWLPVRESVGRCFCTARRRASREQLRLAPFSLCHSALGGDSPKLKGGSPPLTHAIRNSSTCIPLCRLAASYDVSWPLSATAVALLNGREIGSGNVPQRIDLMRRRRCLAETNT